MSDDNTLLGTENAEQVDTTENLQSQKPDASPKDDTAEKFYDNSEDRKPEGQAVEEKPEGEQEQKSDDKEEKSDDKEEGKEEEIELDLPESSRVSEKRRDEIVAYAKEQGLSKEAAQAMLEGEHNAVVAFEEQRVGEFKELVKGWEKEAKSDADIGGEKFNMSLVNAKKALGQFGNEKLTQLLNSSGLGSHPEVVRAFAKIGEAMGESFIEGDRKPLANSDDPAKLFYPDQQ